jgi:hypothetical protein
MLGLAVMLIFWLTPLLDVPQATLSPHLKPLPIGACAKRISRQH